MAGALVNIPATAQRGEIIEIKALVSHIMETGFRRTERGQLVPRDLIRQFTCTYNGAEVFRAEFHAAVAANPFIVFPLRVTESGKITLAWTGDNGFSLSESAEIRIV
jgi:sulfur-oxidizing protein SoxZ